MKTRIILVIGILLSGYSLVISKELSTGKSLNQKGAITIFASPDLYPLTSKWVSEYNQLNPGMNIELLKSETKDISAVLKKGNGIGFVTDGSLSEVNNQSPWSMTVGRNVIVPVMNSMNPLKDEINRTGITSAELDRMFRSSENPTWGMLLPNSKNTPVTPLHFYFVNDPAINSGVADFVKENQYKPAGIQVSSEQEMIAVIQKDPNALGFCKLLQIVNPNDQSIAEHVQLVPIDKNGNGRIDYMEAIYSNLQDFSRGVWIGKYPNELSGHIYSVSSAKPKNEAELAFLNWILTDGQKTLNANGFTDLVLSERQTQLAKIHEPALYTTAPASSFSMLKGILIVLFVLVVLSIITDTVLRRNKIRRAIITNRTSDIPGIFDENTVLIPKGIYFDKTHTWAFMKKDGLVKIGIDDFLLHITGPLTRVEMKNCGDKIKKGEHLLTIIQQGKQLNIYSPVTGTIKTQNSNLLNDVALLNTDPFIDGWIYTIEPANWSLEIQFMNMAEKYTQWLKTEYSRLKDFFALATRVHVPAFVMVLQDGGVLRDGILADLGPEIWEDFQTKYIDVTK